MLGLSKSFVIFLFLSIAVAYGMKTWKAGAWIMFLYIVVKITWKFFTR